MSDKIKSKSELEANIYSLFSEKPEEKKKFLSNPKDFLKENFDVNLPEKIKVKVTEFDRNELVITLPKEIKTSGELSEEELDNVSGGTDGDYTNGQETCGDIGGSGGFSTCTTNPWP